MWMDPLAGGGGRYGEAKSAVEYDWYLQQQVPTGEDWRQLWEASEGNAMRAVDISVLNSARQLNATAN